MFGNDRSTPRIASPRNKQLAVALLVAVAIMGAAGHLFSKRNVFDVSVRPGTSTYVDVEVPMQRFGRSKSFAKERGLPMTCAVSSVDHDDGGVHISVDEKWHTVHKLRARLRIRADRSAARGTRRYSVEFTIDGQGEWPAATVAVTVLTTQSS